MTYFYLNYSKCIGCEYVYDKNYHPFTTICANGCNLCYLCLNKIEGTELIVLCPNMFCNGKFLNENVKKIKNNNDYLKILENIQSDKNQKQKETVEDFEEIKVEEINFKYDENKNYQNDFEFEEKEIKGEKKKIEWPVNFNKANLNSNVRNDREKNNFNFSSLEKFSPIKLNENYSQISSDNKNLLSSQDDICDTPAKKNRISNQSNISMASKPISNFSDKSFIPKENKKSVKCIRCTNVIFLIDGKNLVSCQSPFCQGKINFCKLCEELVNVKDLPSHFPKGVYINTCINKHKNSQQTSVSNSIISLK